MLYLCGWYCTCTLLHPQYLPIGFTCFDFAACTAFTDPAHDTVDTVLALKPLHPHAILIPRKGRYDKLCRASKRHTIFLYW